MSAVTVQGHPAAMERFSRATAASLEPVDQAVEHYRRALAAFRSARNDVRTPPLADLTAAIAAEVHALAALDAVPARLAAGLVGADAARVALVPGHLRVPAARAASVARPVPRPGRPDGTLLPRPPWFGPDHDDWRDDPRWRAFRHGVLGPYLLPSDLLDTPLGRRIRRWLEAGGRPTSGRGLTRYGRIAGPIGTVLGILDLRRDLYTVFYGSEHGGLRGAGDRVAAGLSIGVTVGGVLAAGAWLVGTPPGWAVLGVAATVTGIWSLGTLVWDQREAIARRHLTRVDLRGQHVDWAGRQLQSTGRTLSTASQVLGGGIRVGSHLLADRLEEGTGTMADAGDRLADLQRDLAARLEDAAESYGPIAERAAERAADVLTDHADRTASVSSTTPAVGTAFGTGLRRVGDAAGDTVQRVGRRTGRGVEETGNGVRRLGSGIRDGAAVVGSWFGFGDGRDACEDDDAPDTAVGATPPSLAPAGSGSW